VFLKYVSFIHFKIFIIIIPIRCTLRAPQGANYVHLECNFVKACGRSNVCPRYFSVTSTFDSGSNGLVRRAREKR
jgi:hypothetical protein